MSSGKPSSPRSEEQEPGSSGGPNLKLIYGLIALGFLVAMAVASFIVLPFYHRH